MRLVLCKEPVLWWYMIIITIIKFSHTSCSQWRLNRVCVYSKCIYQIRFNKKNAFICFEQMQCLYRMSFLFELVYFRTIDKQVLISMPLVGTDVYEMCFIMWDLKKNLHDIFGSKSKHGGKDVGNSLVYIRPLYLIFSEMIHWILKNVISVKNKNNFWYIGEWSKLTRSLIFKGYCVQVLKEKKKMEA